MHADFITMQMETISYALDRYYGDTSRSEEKTLAELQELRSDLDIYIIALEKQLSRADIAVKAARKRRFK